WMTAAGREAIPCAFVVDKTGRIAYIGNPIFLGSAVAKAVVGNKSAKEIGEEIAQIADEANAIYGGIPSEEPTADLQAIQCLAAKYPSLTNKIIRRRAQFASIPKRS